MKSMICLLLRFYLKFISPPLHLLGGPGFGCRYEPTCSEYFLQAVRLHGAVRGSWLGLRRLARCQPWGGQGYDPVPCVDQTCSGHSGHPPHHP